MVWPSILSQDYFVVVGDESSQCSTSLLNTGRTAHESGRSELASCCFWAMCALRGRCRLALLDELAEKAGFGPPIIVSQKLTTRTSHGVYTVVGYVKALEVFFQPCEVFAIDVGNPCLTPHVFYGTNKLFLVDVVQVRHDVV